MGTFTRGTEESATYTSDRGRVWRLLASVTLPGAWMVYPQFADIDEWKRAGELPSYVAIPHTAVAGADWCGYKVCRLDRTAAVDPGTGTRLVVVGYGFNLGDVVWPAEDNLIGRLAALRGIEEVSAAWHGRPRATRSAISRR